jgi:CheY-like chemotaxis protein
MVAPESPPAGTIIMVDDNRDLLELFSDALHDLGKFTVVCAANGEEALEQAMSLHPDCMVIDIVMPQLNGFQLVHALRGDPASRDIPLVILTALAQDREQFIGLAAGADAYLVKPVAPQALIAAIRQATAISQAERVRRYLALTDDPSLQR